MKIGISTATLFTRLYNEDALALFNEWKIPLAEVFLTSFSEYNEGFAQKLKEKKGSVEVHSVHVLNTQFEPQLYSDHPRVRADAYYWLDKAMTSAKVLGAKYYTFHGVARLKRTFREDIPRIGALTREIYAFCQKYGVKLCYENVEWAFYNRPDIFRGLLAECPSLGGVLDIKQARLSGYDYRDYLSAMENRIEHVHVSDFDGDNMCLPGRGTFDFDELFARLQGVGFDGAVIIENYGKDYGDLGQLKESYEFLAEKARRRSN